VRFDLSDDQRALREAAREVLEKGASSERVRAAFGTPYDAGLFRTMADQGWLAVLVPESAGGLGLGVVEAAVLAEAVGRFVAPAPFLPTAVAAWALSSAGHDVAALVDGSAPAAVAWRGAPVVDGSGAAVVVHIDGEAVRSGPAVGAVPVPALDPTRALARLDLSGLQRVDVDVAALTDRLAVLVSAEILGAAERMLEESVEYAKTREQFGRPIGSFQAVKHRCADMLVDVEGMRSAVWYAAWAVDAGAPDASLAASTAKAWCSDAGPRVLASALQVHGGIGFTWDHDLHLYLKRVQVDAMSFGDAAFHRERITTLL
jgi:alkylation response protein AidB-like acyl-CoA dehydrogenase